MKPRLSFRKQARAELLDARAWYDASAPGLGLDFARAVDAALERVQRMPEAFPVLSGSVRQVVLRRFPYSILFAYENQEVVVLVVHHHRKKPTRWNRRRGV
jgi:plasmid stabilization system protein ParE